MAASPLLPVADALAAIVAGVQPTEVEHVAITHCRTRVLAQDLAALRTQPPFSTSAMDGYAIRAADVTAPGTQLRLVGVSAAGHGFAGEMAPGQTVRIFTGAPLPTGADTILIQENASVSNEMVTAHQVEPLGRFIRSAGLDFREGQVLLHAGTMLGARELGLAAAMNHAMIPVRKRPRVAILATGDELVFPGEIPGPDQIVASNNLAVAAAVEAAGGEALMLGIARDDFASLEQAIHAARDQNADVLVTIGGASVGEHDLVQSALLREGMSLAFWRIAMRPGKPLLFGALGPMRIIGLPGNPVSSIVCALVFIRPLIRALLGMPDAMADQTRPALAGKAMPGNDERQDYVRARISGERDGVPVVTPHARQDSSMLSTLGASDALIIRAPHAPVLEAGAPCRIIPLTLLDQQRS